MTAIVRLTQIPLRSFPLGRGLWLSGSKDVHGREGRSSDILYNSSCYQRSATLLDVPLQPWKKILSQQIFFFFFFFLRMCSLGFKGEIEIIPLNCLSLWLKMFSRKCVEVLAVELLLIFFFWRALLQLVNSDSLTTLQNKPPVYPRGKNGVQS